MIRALITAPSSAANVRVVVRGTALEAMARILMGVSHEDHARERHKDESNHSNPDAVGHGWGSPRGVGIAADQMGCPC
jgi:hypothetical protein